MPLFSKTSLETTGFSVKRKITFFGEKNSLILFKSSKIPFIEKKRLIHVKEKASLFQVRNEVGALGAVASMGSGGREGAETTDGHFFKSLDGYT